MNVVSLVSRISVITGDVLVLAVTWTKTARLYREGRRIKMSTPLATLLIRDGAVAYLVSALTISFTLLTGTLHFVYAYPSAH